MHLWGKRAFAVALAGAALAATAAGAASPPPDPPPYDNPVVQGDFPDPSVVRVGHEYWAITTASSGQPSPPILRSPDLASWSHAGYLLLDPPEWSSGRQLWAPSIERNGGRFLVYYSARKKYGRPCVTVADSDMPIGPYTDHGPLVCQASASIDPSVTYNQHGTPFLIWKQNGGATTPSTLWAQPLTPDGMQLTGRRRAIMRGNRKNWEGGLAEGPNIVRRHGWLYLFYSGGRCCSPKDCRYAMGVARSKSLYGPWRRYKRNPILRSDDHWFCRGHGSVIQSPSGHWWLLYHAYRAPRSRAKGRQLLLDLVHWSRDGWPVMKPGSRPLSG